MGAMARAASMIGADAGDSSKSSTREDGISKKALKDGDDELASVEVRNFPAD
jgi:hypothetical protein